MRRIDGGTVTTARPATANRFRSHRRAGLAALGLVASACTSGSARAGMSAGNGRAVFRLAIDEPSAIDPARAVESEGLLVTKQLYDGLLRLDPQTQAVRPGVAERWESNQTCTAWTFHLRRGTTFSNGEPVTARSFIDGMTRAAARAATSQVA